MKKYKIYVKEVFFNVAFYSTEESMHVPSYCEPFVKWKYHM